jgi:hypothetical protein
MQQGRVIVDDDWNERERIHRDDAMDTTADIIGAHGSPDSGFRIGNEQNGRIIASADLEGKIDFKIHAGTYYLGGLRLRLENDEAYRTQSDWLQLYDEEAVLPPTDGRIDLVYLEAWEQPVSAVEDSETFEAALGGADTSGRMRIMQRVKMLEDVKSSDCAEAWQVAAENWAEAGQGTVDDKNEVKTSTRLSVSFKQDGTSGNLCTPAVGGGYLGAENQTLRVQLRNDHKLTWGYDNASTLYRVLIESDQVTVKLLTAPKDEAHWPNSRHVVEILPWDAVLPNGEKIAALQGHISRIDTPYAPETGELELETAVPNNFGKGWEQRSDSDKLDDPSPTDPDNAKYFYMRVWDRGFGEGAINSEVEYFLDTPIELPTIGVKVTISGETGLSSDHWVVALRPETPSTVVPWKLVHDSPPNGIRRFRAPLALIRWQQEGNEMVGLVHDCRRRFRPLTQLGTCCKVTVGDGMHSYGDYTSIQDAIDSLSPSGGHVCILPGLYEETIRIVNREAITISGCGVQTVINAPEEIFESLLLIENSRDIIIKSLSITALSSIGIHVRHYHSSDPQSIRGFPVRNIGLEDLDIIARDLSAVFVRGGKFFSLKHCRINIKPLIMEIKPEEHIDKTGKMPAVFVTARDALIVGNVIVTESDKIITTASGGLQIGGESQRVEIRRNRIIGGNGNGITLGSVSYVSQQKYEYVDTSQEPYLFQAEHYWVGAAIFVGPTGCIELSEDPEPPKDAEDNALVPVSDGRLESLQILDNEIARMGGDGVGVARFFNLEVNQEIISINRLFIESNRIYDCERIPRSGSQPEMLYQVGHGGIALADCEFVFIRRNFIEYNGFRHEGPVCGIFMLNGEGVFIEGNYIAGNGRRVREETQPALGNRGGILILNAQPLLNERLISKVLANDLTGGFNLTLPTARIHDNVVMAPEGRALELIGMGTFAIEGNQFVSQTWRKLEVDSLLQSKEKYTDPLMAYTYLLALNVGSVMVINLSGDTGEDAGLGIEEGYLAGKSS